MKIVPKEYAACPIRNVIDRFGNKWSMLILYILDKGGTLRFSEIQREMVDISQKMLSTTLKRLEEDRLITRTVYPEVPPRVEYALTEVGKSLMPHILGLTTWAVEHFDDVAGSNS
ncbi:MAG: helix-turn-helix domain-containing protein [Bacteroides graminisolvens]|nr:helix-turn-helix domain-containing protein [Bacteroides graminisolvens]